MYESLRSAIEHGSAKGPASFSADMLLDGLPVSTLLRIAGAYVMRCQDHRLQMVLDGYQYAPQALRRRYHADLAVANHCVALAIYAGTLPLVQEINKDPAILDWLDLAETVEYAREIGGFCQALVELDGAAARHNEGVY